MKITTYILLIVTILSCSKNQQNLSQFSRVSSSHSNVNFKNTLIESDSLNYFTYPYIYMGGGIAVGDFNNDQQDDIYFTGNMSSNKLYLNKGNLTFEDISIASESALNNDWYLGATTVDINLDGWLDIYLSVSGPQDNCPNKLLINQGLNKNGIPTFKEEAVKYGLADGGHSSQSTFFDYDNDGDLDLYVANYPITPFKTTPNTFQQHIKHATLKHSNHLYENEGNGHFKDVTEKANLLSYSLSLSATVSDINNDGYKDIYVSNDFASADFCYINNGDGTFRNTIETSTKHTALYGMGADITDFNNDGHLDIFQVDMDASTNKRSKANMASMNPQVFWDTYNSGLYYQYMHNCLQLNTGITKEDKTPLFNNISRLANVSTTDWSWGPLFADLDNDGWKDLYISNGTRREINNTDFFNALKANKSSFKSDNKQKHLENTLKMPSEKTDNFAYKNNGDLTFRKINKEWGIEFEGFSNGVAYADLDNDGDLEIILNNIDDEAVIFENNNLNLNNYLTLRFNGPKTNPLGVGVKCTIYTNEKKQFQELSLERGYISAMAPKLHFGLGQINEIDSMKIEWPDGKIQKISDVKVNKSITIKYQSAYTHKNYNEIAENTLFSSSDKSLNYIYKHQENNFDDFKNEILLPHKTSNFGPFVSVGDVNQDHLEDFYVGGAVGQNGRIFTQNKDGSFTQNELNNDDFIYEDMGSLFFDADNDNDLDMYVVSGGNEFQNQPDLLQDRLYINNGKGKFTKNEEALPTISSSGSRVYAFDYDNDGDEDLLVCGRLIPGKYPAPAKSYILTNESSSNNALFKDYTNDLVPEFNALGLATAAVLKDIDKDGFTDIIISGEWMGIKVFKNLDGNGFKDITSDMGLDDTTGWWFSLSVGDFDNDGDLDLVAGNLGLNYKYKSNGKATFDIYYKDFDNNDKADIVLSYFNEGEKFPVRGRSCSSSQIESIKKKFKTYNEFAEATLVDVYGEDNLNDALHYQVNTFATSYFENDNGKFIKHQLPNEIQFSSVNQIIVDDYNKDGNLDIIGVGNLYASEIETPRNDAGTGIVLLGDGKGQFKSLSIQESGLYTPGDVKDMSPIKIGKKPMLLISNNNDYLKFIEINTL